MRPVALAGAGSVIARAAQQLGARQIEEILAREGADALATRLEAESLSPRGTLGAARAWSIKARLNAVNLPTSGKIRFVPERGYDANVPLRRGPNHGFVDRFGNEWVRGASRTQGQAFEWDVQLSRLARTRLGWASRDGAHVDVLLDGRITH
jgi:filamentous hemagglutinin